MDYYVRDEKGVLLPAIEVPRVDNQPFHTMIGKKRSDYNAADVLSGSEKFVDGSYACKSMFPLTRHVANPLPRLTYSKAIFMVSKHPERFRLSQWFRYSEDYSWPEPFIGSYHFCIADEIDINMHRMRFDGAIGLGLQP